MTNEHSDFQLTGLILEKLFPYEKKLISIYKKKYKKGELVDGVKIRNPLREDWPKLIYKYASSETVADKIIVACHTRGMRRIQTHLRRTKGNIPDYRPIEGWKDYKRRAHEDLLSESPTQKFYASHLGWPEPSSIELKDMAKTIKKLKKPSVVELKKKLMDSNERPTEGKPLNVTLTRYERNRKARMTCIAVKGYDCSVCGMNFEKNYGNIGKGFIQVHHKQPISFNSGEREVNPVKDLDPVCPNCHAMLHVSNPPFSIAEIRRRLIKK